MTLSAAVRLFVILAAVLSLPLARRVPSYRPVAAVLCVVAVRAVLRGLLRLAWPALALPRVPASVPRAVLHLDLALYLAWPASIVALSLAVCLGLRAWPALVAWAGALATLAGFSLRAAVALEVGTFLEVAALAFATGAILQWSGRGKVPRLPHVALVLVVVFDGLALLVTRGGDVVALWPSALACYLVLFASIAIVQGGALCHRFK
jgi:hypothetical protein